MKTAFQRHYEEQSDVWTTDIGMRILPLLVEGKLNLQSHFRLLDIGCGSGADTMIYSPLCEKVIGVDICQHYSWEAIQKRTPNIRFVCADFLEFTSVDKLNIIVDNGCFHHQSREAIPGYLEKVRSLLTSDGSFIISTFCDADRKTYTDDYQRIHHYFTTEELGELLAQSGFVITDTIMIYRPKYNNYYRITFSHL